MIPTNAIAIRDQQRVELDSAVSQFLASGGAIQKLSHVERAPHRPISYNNRVDRKTKFRREYEELERKIAEHARAFAGIGATANQAMRQMQKRWEGQAVITAPKLEQIAAKYGFVFECDERGRP